MGGVTIVTSLLTKWGNDNEREKQVKCLLSMIDGIISENEGMYYSNDMYKEAEKIVKMIEEDIEKNRIEEHERKIEEIEKKVSQKYSNVEEQIRKKDIQNYRISGMQRGNKLKKMTHLQIFLF